MKEIDSIIDKVIDAEGGFVNHPSDKGGPTKYGITQATLSEWWGIPATVDDVRNLQRVVAEDIYHRNYYLRPGIHSLPKSLRGIMFDMAVNHGPSRAIKLLQKSISRFEPVTVDGIIGPKTLAGTERAMAGFMVNALVDTRIEFYNDIVAIRPSQGVFLAGWLARAEKFRKRTQYDIA